MRFFDGHLQRRVAIGNWNDSMLGRVSRQLSPAACKAGLQAKESAVQKSADRSQVRTCSSVRSAIRSCRCPMPKINDVMRTHCVSRAAPAPPHTHPAVESLVHIFQIGRVDGLHADKDPLPSRIRYQVAPVPRRASRLALICATQCTARPAAMMSRQQSDFVR